MAGHRPLRRALLTVGALALLASCGDDGGETTRAGLDPAETTEEVPTSEEGTTTEGSEASATTGPATTEADDGGVAAELADQVCTGFQGFFPRPVGSEEPEDDAPVLAALEDLAADGPDALAAQAQALLDLQALDDGEVDALQADPEELEAAYQAGLEAAEGLYAWALGACPSTEVAWSCLEVEGHEEFTKVGEAIEGPDGETEVVTTTTEPGAATPEAVYAEAQEDGEPVEVRRSEDEVVVAWVDDAGHAVVAMEVVDDDGWRADETTRCVEEGDEASEDDGFEVVGEEIE